MYSNIVQIKQKFPTTVHIRCETETNAKIEQLVLGGTQKLQVIKKKNIKKSYKFIIYTKFYCCKDKLKKCFITFVKKQ